MIVSPAPGRASAPRALSVSGLTLAGSAISTLAFSLITSRSSELWLLSLSGITFAFSASSSSSKSPCCCCCCRDVFVDDGAANVVVGMARLPLPLSVLVRSESSGRGSPLRKRRSGLDHLAKQRESTSASANRDAMTRTPTRLVWPSLACVVVVVVVDAVVVLSSLDRGEMQ